MKKNISLIYQSIALLMILSAVFMLVEPAIALGVEDQFTITQVVSAEIAFLTPATDIVLVPTLAGMTGGTSNGGTQVAVRSNNDTGYTMTIKASSTIGSMVGNTAGGSIPAYVTATPGVPDYDMTPAANTAGFAYTVEASTTADLSTSFKDSASACDASGGSDTQLQCWIAATSTEYTLVNRSTATAASGSTTTLRFRVVINANPLPLIPDDTYVATTTLTAVNN